MNISHIKMPERLRRVPCGVVAVLGFCICAGLGMMSLLVLADMQTAAFNETIPEQLVVSMRNVWHVLPMFALLSMALLVLGGGKKISHGRLRDESPWPQPSCRWRLGCGGKARLKAGLSQTKTPFGRPPAPLQDKEKSHRKTLTI